MVSAIPSATAAFIIFIVFSPFLSVLNSGTVVSLFGKRKRLLPQVFSYKSRTFFRKYFIKFWCRCLYSKKTFSI